MNGMNRALLGGLVFLLSACSADVTIKPADPVVKTPVKLNTTEPSISIDPLSRNLINLQNFGAFTLSGSCSIENAAISLSSNGASMAKSLCVAGKWSTQAQDFKFLSDGDVTIQADLLSADSASILTSASVELFKDTAASTVAISYPTPNLVINAALNSTFRISGACSEEGRPVYIFRETEKLAEILCQGGAFQSALLPSLPEGSLQIEVTHSDASENRVSVQRAFSKVTAGPRIAITFPATNGQVFNAASTPAFTKVTGTCSENGRPVRIYNLINPTTPVATVNCTSGAFDSGALTFADNVSIQIKAQTSDAYGNEADVVRNVSKDTVSPTVTIATPSALAEINASSPPLPTVTGTCSENGRSISIVSGASTLATATCQGGTFTSTSLDLSGVTEGTFTISVSQSDLAGNLTTTTRSLRKYTIRNSTLTPVVIPPPTSPKFKVVFVVDNSPSMGDEQQYLASGVSSLMNRFKNADGTSKFDVDFYIHTTSSTLWTSSSFKSPATRVTSYATNDLAGGASRELPTYPFPWTVTFDYLQVYDRWELLPAYNGPSSLKLVKGAQAGPVQSALTTAITSIGVNGADYESGLCTMGRLLVGDSVNNIVEPNDKIAFVVLSDTDDYSAATYNYCRYDIRSNYRRNVTQSSTAAASLAETDFQNYRFQGHHYWYHYDYDCQSCSDGVCGGWQTCSVGWNLWAYRVNPTTHGISTATCSATAQACPASLERALGISSLRNGRNCTVSCAADSQAVDSLSTALLSNPKGLVGSDLCSVGFSYQSKTYSNIQDYMQREELVYGPGTCTVSNYKYVDTAEWKSMPSTTRNVDEVLRARSSDSFVDAIYNGLQIKLGDKNFVVTALINDSDLGTAQCRAQAEGTGKKYRELVNKLGNQGSFHSICDTDYYQALEPIKTFFESHVQVEFPVTLAANESISSVSIRRAGQPTIVLSATDFTYSAGILKIRDGLVQAGDVLELVIRQG